MRKSFIVGLEVAALFVLGSCGGSSDGGGSGGFTNTGSIHYTAGVFPASSSFANQCEAPRIGMCPWGSACPDKQGSALAEKHFLRSWTNELYLWYDEVPDTNPANASGTVEDYFDTLRTQAILPSGQAKDRFHFTYNTADYYAQSVSGVAQGYGIDWVVIAATPPRNLVVSEVKAGSAAANGGVTRGAKLASVDGVDVDDNTQAGIDVINEALFAPDAGSVHAFVFRDVGTGQLRSLSLAATAITENPVPVVAVNTIGQSKVGYILFNDHIATAEGALKNAIQQLATAQVNDLVLDLRYNGGGYLDIAAELAYMIAGPATTTGKTFEKVNFNSKYPSVDPVTHDVITPTLFWPTAQGFDAAVPIGTALPTLNLPRVYVLTSGNTCSASESIINGLRGVGIAVYQFGGDTCGKPYGFYPDDNCGTTYFSIQFRGVNQQGFGDYAEGFSATRVNAVPGTLLPGCAANDDFSHELGNPLEGQLAVALHYYSTSQCVITSLGEVRPEIPGQQKLQNSGGLAVQPAENPFRHNRILR